MKDFEVLPHTADLKIRVFGGTLKELFRNAVVGMFQSIGPQVAGCTRTSNRIVCPSLPSRRSFEVISVNQDCLLVDFLSEALYCSDVYDEAYLDAEIHELDEKSINVTLLGIAVQGFEVVELKAVTYHELAIKNVGNHWQVDIVFDI